MIYNVIKDAGKACLRAVGALALCFALTCAVAPGAAFADVRKADVIAGMTVEERGLTVAECPSIDAEHAALVGADGTVYFSRASEEPAQIASITKVMTAIVALDYADPSTKVVVSEAAATIGESSANLQEGDVMDLETALKALMVPSGNDAAVALGEAVGKQIMEANPGMGDDPMSAFVAAMNAKAAEIGCEDTVYENTHGLDDDEFIGDLHSTAADQAKVARCAMGYDLLRQIVASGDTVITVEREGERVNLDLETTDELLEMYDAAIGIKTGMTNLAGPSFMGAASRDGRELYAIVLGSTDEYQRFADAENMFEWAYDHVREVKLANSDSTASLNGKDVPLIAEVSHADWIDKTVKATMSDPDAVIQVFDLEGNVSQSLNLNELHGTVRAGDKVGTIVFKQRNKVVAEQDLIACETVEAPNGLDALGIWWQRLFDGADAKAASRVYNVMPIINSNVSAAA